MFLLTYALATDEPSSPIPNVLPSWDDQVTLNSVVFKIELTFEWFVAVSMADASAVLDALMVASAIALVRDSDQFWFVPDVIGWMSQLLSTVAVSTLFFKDRNEALYGLPFEKVIFSKYKSFYAEKR